MKNYSIKLCDLLLAITFVSPLNIVASDHLEPLGLVNKEEALLYESLIQTKDRNMVFLWMTQAPSLSSIIQAVVIDAQIEFELIDDHSERVKSMEFYLRSVSTAPKLPYDPTRRYQTAGLDNLECYEIQVEEAFADLMKEAWISVLKQTRYPDHIYMYLDGTVYTFGSGIYIGRTLSPNTGLSSMLYELSNQLKSLARSNKRDRESIQNKCTELAGLIIKKANSNQGIDPTPANAQSSVPSD